MTTALEKSINTLLHDCKSVLAALEDLGPDTRLTLDARLGDFVAHLNSLKALGDVPVTQIPLQVLQMVDAEENPDRFLVNAVRVYQREWTESIVAKDALDALATSLISQTRQYSNEQDQQMMVNE
eukprot:ANDGO_05577.mRNA.1 hypothetical protein